MEEGLEMQGGGIWGPGEWTDDTALALALAESIADHGLLDIDDLSRRYTAWAESGPKDIGIITRTALAGPLMRKTPRTEPRATTRTRGTHRRERHDHARSTHRARGKVGGGGRRSCAEDATLTHFDPAAGSASAALCAAVMATAAGDDPRGAAEEQLGGHRELTEALEAARIEIRNT